MFNRKLEVKVVKAKKEPAQPSQNDVTYEGKVAIIGRTFERCITKVGAVVIFVVAADCVKQVLVEMAKRP